MSQSNSMCKYHGPFCENPSYCSERHPRKYEGDGTMERIDAARLQVGHVVRMNGREDRMSAFSSSVVLQIRVVYSDKRRKSEKVGEYNTFDSLDEAMGARKDGDYIYVKLARPFLYEHHGSPLMSCETYEVDFPRMLDCYKVVVQSTGEYDRRTASFTTIYQDVRVAEERQAEMNPHRGPQHNHIHRDDKFPHTCMACKAEATK